MNKRRKCCMMLVLAMVLCAGKGVAVSAATVEPVVPEMLGLPEGQEVQVVMENGTPRYLYTTSITSQVLFIDGVAYVGGSVSGVESRTTQIYGYLYLQKKNGSSWTNVRTWNKSAADFAVNISESASGLAAGTYRARFVAYVYEGSNYEVATFESSEKVYNP